MTRLHCVTRPRAELRRLQLRLRQLLLAAMLSGLAAGALTGCGTAPLPLNPAQQSAVVASQSAARSLARGDLSQARAQYERALATAESVEDFALAGTTLLNLALLHGRMGELAAGHARVDRILAAPQRYGAALQAQAATRKSLLYIDVPDLEAALIWADKAQAACAAPCELSAVLSNLRAHVALQRGDFPQAAQWATRAAALGVQSGQAAEQANALRLQGRAQSRLGQTADAAVALALALAIDQRLGLPERVALDLLYAGENEQRRAQTAVARDYFERALVVYQAAGLPLAAEAVRARIAALATGATAAPTRP